MQCRVGPGRRPGGSSSSPVVPERPSARRHCRVRDVMADTSSGGERQQRGHPKAESGERAELDRQGEAGREASHGMSETFCSACSSQVGRLPMARQKPPRCSPALRPGGFKWHIRNLFSMQLSGWEVSHIMSETSSLFSSSQAGRFPMARQKPSVLQHAALRLEGFP